MNTFPLFANVRLLSIAIICIIAMPMAAFAQGVAAEIKADCSIFRNDPIVGNAIYPLGTYSLIVSKPATGGVTKIEVILYELQGTIWVSNWEPQATIYGETTWSSTGWTQLPGSKRYKVTATLYYWQDLGQGKGKENKQVAASQEIQM
jgi:hypothetical protein